MTALGKLEVPGEAMRENAAADGTSLAAGGEAVSHNLHGQKLGRKGRITRERILAAAAELLADERETPISLSAVARKVPLGMTSLYNYFTDLTELLLAVLEPVMATAEEACIAMLREHWPDEELGDRCYRFIHAYYDFWSRNARLLHLRNNMADSGDRRMMVHRVTATQPVIRLLMDQMHDAGRESDTRALGMATVLMTGIERTVTVSTDDQLTSLFGPNTRLPDEHYLRPEARLMELAIRDTRETLRAAPGE